MEFDLRLNSESIPYNPNPVYLGITFDERLCFNKNFENLLGLWVVWKLKKYSRINLGT